MHVSIDLDSLFKSTSGKIFIFSILLDAALQFLTQLFCLYLVLKELILKYRSKKLHYIINESNIEMAGEI